MTKLYAIFDLALLNSIYKPLKKNVNFLQHLKSKNISAIITDSYPNIETNTHNHLKIILKPDEKII